MCISLGPIEGRYRAGEKTIIFSKTLIFNDYHTVYGGTVVGLLGVFVRAGFVRPALITTVTPEADTIRSGYFRAGGLIMVKDEGERKQRVLEVSEAFIALPGGYGTPGQIRALFARAQPGPHQRPMAFFTMADYRRHVELFLEDIGRGGFIRGTDKLLLVFGMDTNKLLVKNRSRF